MTQKDLALYQNLRTKLARACHQYFDQKLKSGKQRFVDWRLVLNTLVITYGDYDIHHIEVDSEDFLKFTKQL